MLSLFNNSHIIKAESENERGIRAKGGWGASLLLMDEGWVLQAFWEDVKYRSREVTSWFKPEARGPISAKLLPVGCILRALRFSEQGASTKLPSGKWEAA